MANVMKEGQWKSGDKGGALGGDYKAGDYGKSDFKSDVESLKGDVKHASSTVKEKAADIKEHAGEAWRQEMGKLREDLNELRSSLADSFAATRGKAKKVVDDAREYAVHAKDIARDQALHAKDYAVEHGKELEQVIENKVKERPLAAILIAAGIGLAVGAMLRR